MSAVIPLRGRLGARVRNLRLLKGWSQEKLGEEARLSYKFIGEVERGLANPSTDTLGAIAEALGVDVTVLFGPPPETSDPAEYRLTRTESVRAREALDSLAGVIQRFSTPSNTAGRQDTPYKRARRPTRKR